MTAHEQHARGRLIRRTIIQLWLRYEVEQARTETLAYEAGLSAGEREALGAFDRWQALERAPVEPVEVAAPVRERTGLARVYAFDAIRRKKAA